jgi:hypothetical protein
MVLISFGTTSGRLVIKDAAEPSPSWHYLAEAAQADYTR